LLLCTSLTLTSCESPTTTTEQKLDSTTVGTRDRALFVLNEGQYSHSNGSLDVIIYRANGRDTIVDRNILTGLGVGNAVHVIGNRAYVIDDAANKLIAVSADSLKVVGSMSFGLDNPDDITLLGAGRALVTFLYAPRADVIDLASMQVVHSIALPEGSMSSVVLNNKAYITTSSYGAGSHLTIYDIAQEKTLRTIELFPGAGAVVADSVHSRVVVGTVGLYDSTAGRIYWVDPTTDAITDSANTSSKTASLVLMAGGGKVFALDGGVPVRLNETAHTIEPLSIPGTFYNGTYDAVTDQLVLGHNDFSGTPGVVDVYGASDMHRHWSMTAGIAPAHFAFYR
jgi:hypothetical protein